MATIIAPAPPPVAPVDRAPVVAATKGRVDTRCLILIARCLCWATRNSH